MECGPSRARTTDATRVNDDSDGLWPCDPKSFERSGARATQTAGRSHRRGTAPSAPFAGSTLLSGLAQTQQPPAALAAPGD
jgi:hypothetical protein